LAQESPQSELQLQRYGEKNFRDLFVFSRKWLGVDLELFLKIRGYPWKFVDCGLILNKNRGLFAKWHGFMDFRIIFHGKIWWTGCTVRGPTGAARVHGGGGWGQAG
jgi:hypothetical protein